MKSILEAYEVHYRYPGTDAEALSGLSLIIPLHKKTAICGHNGSGKSTFFLHTIGIHRPTSGTILWKEEPLSYRSADIQKLRQQIGLVFQDPEQQLILNTPYEDISYGLRNSGMAEAEIKQRTHHMLATMGLSDLADTPIHHLSLGQKKRVSLAGVLVLEPELLLLDEPTAYLDRLSEQQLVDELNRIHHKGMTIVMATHDMNLAYAWADWILVMDQGKCVMQGTPHEIFQQEAQIQALGLELPLLLDVWRALPEAIRRDATPPRSISEFKQVMAKYK
ncbi:energy-coupling factor ABC transporter ATP-binding protein [Paenibacillus agricola]|uniref:ABC transporter ATP-binding protein n=1 Tax=Paenibacillus agricola TaxID=2716264 RepID=A0ABX0J6V8_9BACL|nr:ABC transporter ATP-binding protein [Paenibacillus agricola]NHN31877.1 ABC transporter ATP-binding protein [Paenibacillus agricola]